MRTQVRIAQWPLLRNSSKASRSSRAWTTSTSTRSPAGQCMRGEAFPNDPAEQLTAQTERLAAPEHRTRRLALERSRVDRPFAGDDEGGASCAFVEPRQVEDELCTLGQLGAHRRE